VSDNDTVHFKGTTQSQEVNDGKGESSDYCQKTRWGWCRRDVDRALFVPDVRTGHWKSSVADSRQRCTTDDQ